jgi:hypothetical protein
MGYWITIGLVFVVFCGGFVYCAVAAALAKKNGKDFDVG